LVIVAGGGNGSRQLWISAALQCVSQSLSRLRTKRAIVLSGNGLFSQCSDSGIETINAFTARQIHDLQRSQMRLETKTHSHSIVPQSNAENTIDF